MIALCSKCYCVNQHKNSSKGTSKRRNDVSWVRYEAALHGSVDRAQNRGFRMRNGRVVTYEQHKLGLSAYYNKRWVLPDGIYTEPIEFHITAR